MKGEKVNDNSNICITRKIPVAKGTTLFDLIMMVLFFFLLSSANAATDHSSLITSYEGSKTCRTCHEEAMQEVVDSIHYKLMGETQDVYNMFTNQPVEGTHGKGNRY